MGYTHYWTIPSLSSWCETWPQLVRDARLILHVANIRLTETGRGANENEQPRIDETVICLNGWDHSSHEAFILEPRTTRFDFCKTARKEYDVVVTAILLRASQLAGDAIEVSSDGDWDNDWDKARDLVEKLWPGEEIRCPWIEEEEEEDDDDDEDLDVLCKDACFLSLAGGCS